VQSVEETDMSPVVAIIAPGMMGSAVGKRLVEHGVKVTTVLGGRTPDSAARAREAGMVPVDEAEAVRADVVLSIVPPAAALPLAEKLLPHLQANRQKPIYVDCNAVSPETAVAIASVITSTGGPFVDAGIVGGPPKPGYEGPVFYASGEAAPRFAALGEFGLKVRVVDGPAGAASAVKMSYAGITKGFTALSAVMMLAAAREGTADILHRELSESQPALLAWLTRQVPAMDSKAYRWVAEMEEIADFVGDDPAARQVFEGYARFYERIAADHDGGKKEVGALADFIGRGQK
jgi:3-hydroxyisobutyrate dehydrogenase-like beta-hydroxyacid dehydrogenase